MLHLQWLPFDNEDYTTAGEVTVLTLIHVQEEGYVLNNSIALLLKCNLYIEGEQ